MRLRSLNPLRWLPCREVTDPGGRVYLRRWPLLRFRGRSLVLHQILRSDYAEAPHDHPWWYLSIVLRSGYREELADGTVLHCRPGHVAWRRADRAHRVLIDPARPAWTLMLRGPSRRRWGFHTRCGWQHWKPYVEKAKRGLPVCED